jgi:methylornithine synthase
MHATRHRLDAILSKALNAEKLSKEDILFLLNLDGADQLNTLFTAAKKLRREHFGDEIFLYGFIFASTYCRNDCRFCYFRRSNPQSRRYRKTRADVVAAARRLAASGVHLIDLTMGEDPAIYNGGDTGFNRLIELIESVKQTAGLPVMISPGVIPTPVLGRLAEAGAAWYACYQETHQRKLFTLLRPGQDYDLRLKTKRDAHHLGLLIEEGLLCGVGETCEDIARSIRVMQDLKADQVRVMNFIPQPGTPMAQQTSSDLRTEAKIIAVMRLALPDRLIPASLDVDGIKGLKRRLDAGANVVTSIVPPGVGLAGVARHCLDIEDGRRTHAAVLKVLATCELRPASIEDYLSWIKSRRLAIKVNPSREEAGC